MRRWLLPVFLALVTLVAGSLAVRQPVAPGAGAAAAISATKAPVLSIRRVPALITQTVGDLRLDQQLDATFADPALAGARDRSCLVVHEGDRVVYERNPGMALLPASNLKLLTAVTVLDTIDPNERLRTEVHAGAPPAPGGVVNGPLWLVGGGDPLLETADYVAADKYQPHPHTSFEQLADQLVAAGVRHVTGGVLGDETRYDTQRYLPTWKPSYVTDAEVAPLGALMVNDGEVRFKPQKATNADNPAVHAATVLTNLLQARGVVVDGGPGAGAAPKGSPVVTSIDSLPIKDMVGEMLKESDNTTAELLTRELGRRVVGQATTAAGVSVIRNHLTSLHLAVNQLVSVDGSGLDRSDRATCGLLLVALSAGKHPADLAAGLPVANKDGTLFDRFKNNPAAGRLRAKTGSLTGVAALSGFVDQLSFSLVANELPRDATGRALQEQVGAALARYPDAPKPDDLAP
jgi:D-alanyl-D-alanine carboxypeptidase/D-alanyl-D-alanine-endopeptidase (penicillin-binding protein 4)